MVHPSTSSNKRRQKRAAATQQQFNKNPSVAESTRIHIRQVLEDFRASNDDVDTFDANLSKFDRVEVHKLCIKMGFKSASSGKGNSRWVSIYKKKGKSNNNNVKKKNNLTSFTFLEEGKVILQDFFSTYPPGDYEEGENVVSTSKNNNDNRGTKTDDMICRPLIKTADIAKKLESVVARMQSDPKLKQITEDRAELPIATFKDVITSTIESHQVVLISGETGCGKTTQVPQYLMDYMWSKDEACKIVCTQPRKDLCNIRSSIGVDNRNLLKEKFRKKIGTPIIVE